MTRTTARSFALVGVFVLPLAVAGCSDDSDSAAPTPSTSASAPDTSNSAAPSSSTPTSSTTTPSSSTASTSAAASSTPTSSSTRPSASSSGPASSSSGSSSSAPKSSSTSARPLDTALANSCVQSLGKIDSTNRVWNSAKRSGSDSRLDSAARTLGTTAGELRTAAAQSSNEGFSSRARSIAGDLDSMRRSWTNDKKVVSERYNDAWRGLRTYCTQQLQP